MSTFLILIWDSINLYTVSDILGGILKKGTTRGSYELARALSKDEWDIVTGVDKLPAQKGIVIPKII